MICNCEIHETCKHCKDDHINEAIAEKVLDELMAWPHWSELVHQNN